MMRRREVTPRELEILELVARGMSNKDIATWCNISEQTVKNHVSYLLMKLEASNRTHAVTLALKSGLLGPQIVSAVR